MIVSLLAVVIATTSALSPRGPFVPGLRENNLRRIGKTNSSWLPFLMKRVN